MRMRDELEQKVGLRFSKGLLAATNQEIYQALLELTQEKLAAARPIGLLSYRGPEGYNLTQQDREELPAVHRACTYQQYQGEKLRRRYNAYSYYAILDAFDTHDAGRGRGGLEQALRSKDRAGVMAEACFKAAGWC